MTSTRSSSAGGRAPRARARPRARRSRASSRSRDGVERHPGLAVANLAQRQLDARSSGRGTRRERPRSRRSTTRPQPRRAPRARAPRRPSAARAYQRAQRRDSTGCAAYTARRGALRLDRRDLRPVERLGRRGHRVLRRARRCGCGGPVVELAVGTGRIAVPIAQAGRAGDRRRPVARACSPSRARSPRSSGVGELVDLRVGDMREPPVDERVPLVICPFRSLLHMPDEREKLRALRAARDAARARRPARLRRLRAEPRGHRGDHGLWLEREPGIFERADWDEDDADAELSVRVGRLRRVDGACTGSRRSSGAR